MDRPYTVIFNKQGKPVVTINNMVADDESKMIQRFVDNGYIVRDVTEDEYKTIHENGNFNPF